MQFSVEKKNVYGIFNSMRDCVYIRRTWFYSFCLCAVAVLACTSRALAADVRVSQFGYDAEDSTRFIQAALDSGAKRIVFDRQKGPWITLPLLARSNQELIFEDGVELQAKRGAFMGIRDYLLTLANVTNVTLRGLGKSGGVLRMHKKDYQKPPYPRSQWRFALRLHSVQDVLVENMSFISSGGDGIIVSEPDEGGAPSRNVTIRNCVCDDNHRQGISVISAENLLVENCVFKNTSGTPPQAGVDIEPNSNVQYLVNVVFRNCVTSGNAGKGLELYLQKLDSTSPPVSVLFDNCRSIGDYTSAAVHGGCLRESDFPKGMVEYRNCSLVSAKGYGLYVSASPASAFDVVFDGCIVSNASRDVRFESAMLRQGITDGVTLKNLKVYQNKPRDWFSAGGMGPGMSPTRISGKVEVVKPDGRREHIVLDRKWAERHLPTINGGVALPPHEGFPDLAVAEPVDRVPGRMVDAAPVAFGKGMRLLFYMSQRGRAAFVARQVVRGKERKSPDGYYVVYALKPDGGRERSWRIDASGLEAHEINFDAPKAGFYELEMNKGGTAHFVLERTSVPVAASAARRKRIILSGNDGAPFSLWFSKRKGTACTAVASGSAYYGFASSVYDPTNCLICKADESLITFYANIPDSSAEGLYRMDFSKGARGVYGWIYLDLYGAPPFFFLTPEKTWRFK